MTELDSGWAGTDTAPDVPRIVDVERALLSRLMFGRDAASYSDLFDELGGLEPRDFFDPANGVVFAAIQRLYADRKPTHPQAIHAYLESSGDLRRARGLQYLLEVTSHPLSASAGRWSVEEILEESRKRATVEVLTRGAQMGEQPGVVSADLIAKVQESLSALTEGRSKGGAVRWDQMLEEELAALDARENTPKNERGLPTGYTDLDRLLCGLRPGQLVVIGARPAMGKTTVAGDFLRNAAFRHDVPSLMFSLEMDRGELSRRILASQYRIPLHHLQAAELTDEEWSKVLHASAAHEGAPLWVDDNAEKTLTDITGEARRLARTNDLGLLVVDHLGLIKAPASRRTSVTREQEVAANARGLKVLAKDLGVPVVVCVQINRGPEHRTDKRPLMSDLRESGAIEADADIVMLIHREDYYEKEGPRAGEVDLIVAKHRGGATDTITLADQLHYGRFIDMAVGL